MEEEKLNKEKSKFFCTACGRVSSATDEDGLCLSPKCRKE